MSGLPTEVLDNVQLGSVYESIETNYWQSVRYYKSGSTQLGDKCLQSAWVECIKWGSDFAKIDHFDQFRQLSGKVAAAMKKRGLNRMSEK